MRLEEAEVWLDHFSRCSPCFREFERLQSQTTQRRKLIWRGAAAAAVIALGSALALRLTSGHNKESNTKTRTLAQIRPTQQLPVALHFEDVSSSRETDEAPEGSLQRLPNRPISLSIYLPPGSETGNYEIAFLRTRSDATPLTKFEGTAQVENGAAVLRTALDLSSFQSGTYVLRFRSAGGRWRYFRVAIS